MIRRALLLLTAMSLAACTPYREPKANCFDLVSRGPAATDCSFTPLEDHGPAEGRR